MGHIVKKTKKAKKLFLTAAVSLLILTLIMSAVMGGRQSVYAADEDIYVDVYVSGIIWPVVGSRVDRTAEVTTSIPEAYKDHRVVWYDIDNNVITDEFFTEEIRCYFRVFVFFNEGYQTETKFNDKTIIENYTAWKTSTTDTGNIYEETGLDIVPDAVIESQKFNVPTEIRVWDKWTDDEVTIAGTGLYDPYAGRKPDTDAYMLEMYPCDEQAEVKVVWYKKGETVPYTDEFVMGELYYAHIEVTRTDMYVWPKSTEIENRFAGIVGMRGISASGGSVSQTVRSATCDDKTVYIDTVYMAAEGGGGTAKGDPDNPVVITKITIEGLNPPATGDLPDRNFTISVEPAGAIEGINSYYVTWTKYEGYRETTMNIDYKDEEAFKDGVEYMAHVTILLNEGYIVSFDKNESTSSSQGYDVGSFNGELVIKNGMKDVDAAVFERFSQSEMPIYDRLRIYYNFQTAQDAKKLKDYIKDDTGKNKDTDKNNDKNSDKNTDKNTDKNDNKGNDKNTDKNTDKNKDKNTDRNKDKDTDRDSDTSEGGFPVWIIIIIVVIVAGGGAGAYFVVRNKKGGKKQGE